MAHQHRSRLNDLYSLSGDRLERDVLRVQPSSYGLDNSYGAGIHAEAGLGARDPYSPSLLDPHLNNQRRDVPARVSPYIADVPYEPGLSTSTVGMNMRSYPSALEGRSLTSQSRDIPVKLNPLIPDMPFERPESLRKVEGLPDPAESTNILFVDNLPTNCSRREVGHLFRPFIGYKDIKVIHREPRQGQDKPKVFCFVEFDDSKCALTAMEALQGYKFDDKKPDSPVLRIHFAKFPFSLPSENGQSGVGR